jgi:hypothetical protein
MTGQENSSIPYKNLTNNSAAMTGKAWLCQTFEQQALFSGV